MKMRPVRRTRTYMSNWKKKRKEAVIEDLGVTDDVAGKNQS